MHLTQPVVVVGVMKWYSSIKHYVTGIMYSTLFDTVRSISTAFYSFVIVNVNWRISHLYFALWQASRLANISSRNLVNIKLVTSVNCLIYDGRNQRIP